LLRGYFRGADDNENENEREQVRLQSVKIDARADAVGKTLGELGLREIGVEVTAIRRRGIRGGEPDAAAKVMINDILVLRGAPAALAHAEERLLSEHPGG
jgi:CPA2 family monovalent cation:H+ antiporter-2